MHHLTHLHGHLAQAYLSFSDLVRRIGADQAEAHQHQREAAQQRLRTELAAVDLFPLTNPTDQRW